MPIEFMDERFYLSLFNVTEVINPLIIKPQMRFPGLIDFR